MKEYQQTPNEQAITNMITKVMMFIKDTLPGEKFIIVHVDVNEFKTQLSSNLHPDIVRYTMEQLVNGKAETRNFMDETGNVLSDDEAKKRYPNLPNDVFLK